jgi:hypothetical protein
MSGGPGLAVSGGHEGHPAERYAGGGSYYKCFRGFSYGCTDPRTAASS